MEHLKGLRFWIIGCILVRVAMVSDTAMADASVTLAWDESSSSDVAGYTLYYGTESGTYSSAVDVGLTTEYTVTNLEVGNTYHFAATAYDEEGSESGYSNEASYTPDGTPPEAPSGLTGSALSIAEVELTWDSSSDQESGISHYIIYRDGAKVGESTSPSFTDTGLDDATTYSYRVSAVNGAGLESDLSDSVSVTTLEGDDRVAHWKFDEGSGSVAEDSSGNGHDGTLYGPVWTSGKIDQALHFDGEDDYVDLGHMDVPGGSGLTIAFWFKADALTDTDSRFVSKAFGPYNEDHYWMISTEDVSALRFRLKAGDSTTLLLSDAEVIETETWHHVAATYDGSAMKLYRDGSVIAKKNKTGDIATNPDIPAAIGNQPAGAGNYPFAGTLDDVRIYDRALSSGEIAELMDSSSSDSGGESESDSTAPSVPTNLSGEALSTSEIELTWNSSSDQESGISHYMIYRDGAKAGESTSLSFTDTGLDEATTYSYRVSAVNGAGLESDLSDSVSVTTLEGNDRIAHWKFDEGSGSVAEDSSDNGHDGTLYGPVWTSGKIDQALHFDGENDYVDLGHMDVPGGSGLTIAFWFKADVLDRTDPRFISKAASRYNGDHYWMISTANSTALRFRLKAGGSTKRVLSRPHVIETDTWHHVAATYDGTTMRLYRDGSVIAEQDKTGDIATNPEVPAAIGNQPEGAGNYPFKGTIDDVRIYDRALSPGEIADLIGSSGINGSTLGSEQGPSGRKALAINTIADSEFRLRVTGKPGERLRLEKSSDLETWSVVEETVFPPDGRIVITPDVSDQETQFFRIAPDQER